MCGKHVGNTDNMFRQWYFDVSDIVRSCTTNSTLGVNFGSAPLIAAAINATPGTEHWPTSPNLIQTPYEIPNREYIRKEQNDFGWDWGPAFASAGPWKPGHLVQLKPGNIYVRNTAIDVRKEGQLPLLIPDQSAPWVINASMDIVGTVSQGAKMNYRLLDSTNKTCFSGALSDVNITSTSATGLTTIDEGAVDRWWPTGYGDQTLYYLEYSLVDRNGSTLATVSKRIGFRTIVVNMFPVSDAQIAQGITPGDNFHFEINGHEIYLKGSNFIPPDVFWPRVTPDLIKRIMGAAKAGKQNMLRVWSSGAYSPDFMHDIADEEGILLWSEFEFSVTLYPDDQAFKDNVREEVIYNARRLSHHPSLAFWAGSNELEKDNLPAVKEDDPDNYDKYLNEYEDLFLYTMFPALLENQRSISYHPTSATLGYLEIDYSLVMPLVPRLYNTTPGYIYGDIGKFGLPTRRSHSDNLLNQTDIITILRSRSTFRPTPSVASRMSSGSPPCLRGNHGNSRLTLNTCTSTRLSLCCGTSTTRRKVSMRRIL